MRCLDYGANITQHAVLITAAKLAYVQHHVDFSRAGLYGFDGFGTLYGSGIGAQRKPDHGTVLHLRPGDFRRHQRRPIWIHAG